MIKENIDTAHLITEEQFAKNNHSLLNLSVGGRYVVISHLGGGAFGEVYKAYDRLNPDERTVVIKQLFLSRIQKFSKSEQQKRLKLRYANDEDKILRKFDHPNILPWYKTYVNKDFKLIVTKYCNEGNLYEAINSQKSFQLDHAINALQQICEAIATLHIQKIVHRDLKPQNIFIHNGVYILGDFGLSKVMNESADQLNTVCGTQYTRAPEVMAQRYKLNADIYSIGVILYIMLCPEGTIEQRGRKAQKMDLKKISFKMKNGEQIPPEVGDFLQKSLQRDPQKRMNWIDLKQAPILKLISKQKIPSSYHIKCQGNSIRSLVSSIHSKNDWILDNQNRLSTREQEDINAKFKDEVNAKIQIINEEEIRKLKKEIQQKLDSQTQIYKSFQQFHLWAKIAEYMYTQIILPIQKHELLDLKNREIIKIMYMLSSRCFLYMSRVKDKSYRLPYERFDEQAKYFITDQIGEIYEKCAQKFKSYSKKLEDSENKFTSIISDRFQKIMNKQEFEKEDKILNGILNIDYSEEQHIEWVQNALENINKLNTNNRTLNDRMLAKFKAYASITKIKLEDTKKRSFQDIIEQFIYELI